MRNKSSLFTLIFSGKKWYCSKDTAIYNQLLLKVFWHADILQTCFRFLNGMNIRAVTIDKMDFKYRPVLVA